ncbi:HlyD family type I secretion periplasmic adaptor subunit [Sulfurimonas sp. NWX367]|uniref:HlyD family type I secretion periplasmic adaptor subunit n=1 Tax=unclassified Sulfurimonas TaxID=2623549 RepID=UPI003204ECFC
MQKNQEHELPPHDTAKVIKYGLFILLLMVALLVWAAFNPLETSVVAPGKVSAGVYKKTVQNQYGGTIKKIYINNGDKVQKGDLLIKLDDVEIKSKLAIAKAKYQETIALVARLEAQKEAREKIDFPKELQNQNARSTQLKIFNVTHKSNNKEREITKNRITELENQMSSLSSMVASKKQNLEAVAEEIKEQKELFKERLVSNEQIRKLQKTYNSLQGEILSNSFDMAKLKEQIVEAKNQQLLREKKFQQEILEKYAKAKSDEADLRSQIIAYEDKLRKTNINAPISGTVVGLNIHTVGGVIKPGEEILSIVPQNEHLIVEAQIQTKDIDKVHRGLEATLKFPAFNVAQLDIVKGKVIYVSADSFTEKRNGTSYYIVKIEVTDAGKKELESKSIVLLPGMPAEAMINIGQRTFLSYIVKPFRDMLGRSFNEE